ncbi:MAG TPA: hypothetical protein VN624_06915 [Rhodanobacter sp.]|nr:hypothetical protein [Rhodanobacter sp.]
MHIALVTDPATRQAAPVRAGMAVGVFRRIVVAAPIFAAGFTPVACVDGAALLAASSN